MKMQVRAVRLKLHPCHHPCLGFVHIPGLSSHIAWVAESLCSMGGAGPSWVGAASSECC